MKYFTKEYYKDSYSKYKYLTIRSTELGFVIYDDKEMGFGFR